MARKMTHAPVYFAIVQARFNPILALDSYAPQIQERLRKQGFPDVQKSALAKFSVNFAAPTDESPPQVPVVRAARYTFSNIDRTAAFILEEGALSLQTTEYDVFDTFSGQFCHGLRIVDDAVSLSFTDRIGFRYLDAVFPKANESLVDYLDLSVLGLGERLQQTMVHSFSETRLRSSSGINVVARVIVQNGAVGFPPDLLPNLLRVPDRFGELQGRHAILDTDGFLERREAFSVDGISDHLQLIHDEIAKTFQATVTPHALKAWE
jgi:uncharacterized protein (TIGR04255 family)